MTVYALLKKQQGLSLSGLLLWSAVLVLVAISGLRIVPAYVEYSTIKKNLTAIAKEVSAQNADLNQVRSSFSKRAQVDNITVIGAKDIKIQKEGNAVVLRTDYTVKIPLAANLSLTIDFKAQSE